MKVPGAWIAVLWLALAGVGGPAAAGQGVPVIAAASDLQFALEEVAAAFRRDTGRDVRLTFGSSGNLARQIEQGAPYQMFLSADEQFVFGLEAKGLTRDRGELYAIGRIVLYAPLGSTLVNRLSAQGLRAAMSEGALKCLAIANPEHAPYGRAARQWLENQGLWESVKPKLVFGENASQAAQFAASGNCDGGIIPYSLALASRIESSGKAALLPAQEHQPLRQRMVLVKTATPDAERFYQYMQRDAARRIMRGYGFVLPGEAS
jgi:molybdate transport system substrate-binding protein